MARTVLAPVQPEVLVWARQSASVSLEDAARTVHVPVDRLEAWERGEEKPPLGMLRTLAEKYKRPLAVLLLPTPPRDFQALRDFRRVDPAERDIPPRVAYEIRRAHERRRLMHEMRREIGEDVEPFRLKVEATENVEAVADRIRAYFHVSFTQQCTWARREKTFEGWRQAIEAKDVLVFVMGGSGGPKVRQVRGFAITSDELPVVAVNGRDKTNGRVFTLLHECVHLALGQAVVENDMTTYRRLPAADRAVERFCNAVAAAVLMPKAEMAKIGASLAKNDGSSWTDAEINVAAQKIGASREAFVIRAVTLGLASRRFYALKRRVFEREYEKFDEAGGEPVPVPPYKQMLGRYGRPFARAVLNSYKERRITMNDAAAFLEVPAKRLEYIAEHAVRGQ